MFIISCSTTKQKKSYTGLDCHVHIHPRGEGLYKGDRADYTQKSSGLSHGCVLSQGYQKRYNKKEFEKYKTLEEFTISRNNWTIDQAKKHQSLIPFFQCRLFG